MKILITGGAGFIGSAVARAVIGKSVDQILVLDKLTYAGNLASLRPIADSPRFPYGSHRQGDELLFAAV